MNLKLSLLVLSSTKSLCAPIFIHLQQGITDGYIYKFVLSHKTQRFSNHFIDVHY